jgi:hypothetical protein
MPPESPRQGREDAQGAQESLVRFEAHEFNHGAMMSVARAQRVIKETREAARDLRRRRARFAILDGDLGRGVPPSF